MYILTIMFNGAANTLTENITQAHPRTLTRFDPFTKKWERRRIEQNPPKLNKISILKVAICKNQGKYIL
jgi:hypothetical protein